MGRQIQVHWCCRGICHLWNVRTRILTIWHHITARELFSGRVTCEVQAQIHTHVHNYNLNVFTNFSKPPQYLIIQNSIWTVPWFSKSASHHPRTLNVWVKSEATPWEICGGWSGNGTGFLLVLLFFPVGFIPWMLHTHMSFVYYWCCRTFVTYSAVK